MSDFNSGGASSVGCAWDCGDPGASLQALLGYVQEQAQQAIDWYWKHKVRKAFLAKSIFFAVVFLISATAVGPIVGRFSRPCTC